VNIKRDLLPFAALLALTAPVGAQAPAPALTPPAVLGAAKTIQFTATHFLGRAGIPIRVSTALLAQPNKAFIRDTDAQTKAISMVYASDGRTQTEYRQSRELYTKSDAAARLNDMDSATFALAALTEFLTPAEFARFHRAAGDPAGVYRMPLGTRGAQTIE